MTLDTACSRITSLKGCKVRLTWMQTDSLPWMSSMLMSPNTFPRRQDRTSIRSKRGRSRANSFSDRCDNDGSTYLVLHDHAQFCSRRIRMKPLISCSWQVVIGLALATSLIHGCETPPEPPRQPLGLD